MAVIPKLGLENKKQVVILTVLVLVLVFYGARNLFSGSDSAPQVAVPAATTPVRKPGAKVVKEPRLDPTLRLDLLAQSESTKYTGSGRNIFTDTPEIEKPLANGTGSNKKTAATYVPPPVPPPPPINLKFFGFASKPGESKKVFLSQGEDVFVAGEGEIVNRRYRIVKISPAGVEIEDMINSNRQTIPLTLG